MDATTHLPSATTPALVRVRLPAHLMNLFQSTERRIELSVTTVDEMLSALDARWPGMRDRICDSTPAIRRHINVFVNGRRASLDTRLAPGTDVFILTAVSGG